MDDGYLNKGSMVISTHSFKKEEVELLCEVLKKKFNILGNINKGGQNKKRQQYVIRIRKESMNKLKELIKEYIHISMLKKQ